MGEQGDSQFRLALVAYRQVGGEGIGIRFRLKLWRLCGHDSRSYRPVRRVAHEGRGRP